MWVTLLIIASTISAIANILIIRIDVKQGGYFSYYTFGDACFLLFLSICPIISIFLLIMNFWEWFSIKINMTGEEFLKKILFIKEGK